MPNAETRLAFAEQYWTSKEGKPFSLKGRPWVVEEFWKPACGFKFWPTTKGKLCEECSMKAGQLCDYDHDYQPHQAATCDGLYMAPIIVTVLDLPRRSGKTFNSLAFAAASVCVSKNEYVTYVASAKDQTDLLFEENLKIPIEANPVLNAMCYVANQEVRVKQTKSKLETVTTSHKSITGRGRTLIIIDEARDVPARVAAALIPAIFDHSGWECPQGHVHHEGKPKILTCSVCGGRLQPWFARLVVESSSGIIEGNENDWFAELVASLAEEPHPNFHLYATNEIINPRVNKMTVGAVQDVFGRLDSMRHYIDVEVNNVARRKGEDFVGKADIDRVVNSHLGQSEGSTDPCVAFLDVSTTVDKTSLIILAARDPKWERCYVARLDYWEPQKQPNGLIDESAILEHLDRYVPMFPGLVSLGVDTRLMPWASHMVKVIKQSKRAWGRKVDAFNGSTDERNAAWSTLEHRILSMTIELPASSELRKELLGVQKYRKVDNSVEVRDRSRTRRHADIAESLAECCRRAFLQQTKRRASMAQVAGIAATSAGSVGRNATPSGYKPVVATVRPGDF